MFSESIYNEACIGYAAEAREAMWSCSVVVGLYPDQAIDALVDFALCRCVSARGRGLFTSWCSVPNAYCAVATSCWTLEGTYLLNLQAVYR